MAVTVADLQVKLGMDDDNFRRGTDAAEKHTTGHFANALKMGMVAAASGAALALGATFKSMTTMEDALVPIGTLLGNTTPQFDAMRESIQNVMKSSPKSAEELGSAAYMILSAGITDTEKATLALKDANALSLAGLGTMAESTDLITSAMNAFKDENLSSSDAAKILFGTVASGKTTISELAQGFGGVAPLASALGVNMNELMSATAAMTSAGIPASQAYSGLKATFANILSPTKDATDAAAKLGIQFDAGALKSKGLHGFLLSVTEGMAAAGITGSDASTMMADLFGSIEAGNAVMALTGPQSEAFATNLTGIAKAGENLDARAKEVSNTLGNRLTTAKNIAMIALADLGTKGLNWLTSVWQEHGEQVKQILGNIGMALSSFGATVGPAIGFLVEMFRTVWPEIQTIVTGVIDSLVQRFGVIIGVIGDVVNFVKLHWPEIETAIRPVLEAVAGLVGAVFELIKTTFDIQTAAIKFIWSRWGDDIMAVVLFVFDHIMPIIEAALGVITNIIRVFTSLLKGEWGDAWDALKGIFTSAWNLFRAQFDLSIDLLWNVLHKLWDFGVQLVGKILEGIWANFPNLYRWLSNLPYELVSAIGDLGAWLFNVGWNAMVGLMNGVYAMAGNIARAVWDTITGPFKAVGQWLRIGSPSKLMEQYGKWTVEGFAQGMEGQSATLGSAAAGSFQTITSAATTVRSSSVTSTGGAVGPVTVNMPPGSSGDDVVRALKAWQERNGALPVRVAS